jgi:NAD(P)-dependent dehydrogenase (short-subunit alcohol dehydrogenase family)
MKTSVSRTMLVYGATGRAGRLVAERALSEGWAVSAFVRNPDKVPEALRSKVTLVKGDLRDAASVSAAVRSTRPNAIVDASSALPFGHAKGQLANNADRGTITKATVQALDVDGRLTECVLLVVGGQLIPEPGGTIDKWSVAAIAWVLRTFVMRREWREAQEVLRWCFDDAARYVRSRRETTSSTEACPTATSRTSWCASHLTRNGHGNVKRSSSITPQRDVVLRYWPPSLWA